MGIYGLNSLSEVFDGKIPMLHKGHVLKGETDVSLPSVPSVDIPKPSSPLSRKINLGERGKNIEAKVFGGLKGTEFGKSKLSIPKGTGFEKMLGTRGVGQTGGFEQMMRARPSFGTSNTHAKIETMLGGRKVSNEHLAKKLGIGKVGSFEQKVFQSVGLNRSKSDEWSRNFKLFGVTITREKEQPTQTEFIPPKTTRYGASQEDIARYYKEKAEREKPGFWKGVVKSIKATTAGDPEEEAYRAEMNRLEKASVAAIRRGVAEDVATSRTWWQAELLKRRKLDEAGIPYAIVNGVAMTIPEMNQRGINVRGTSGKGTDTEQKYKKVGKNQYVMVEGSKKQPDVYWPEAQGYGGYPPQVLYGGSSRYPAPGRLGLTESEPTTKFGKFMKGATVGLQEAVPFATEQKVQRGLAITGGGEQALMFAANVPSRAESLQTMSRTTGGGEGMYRMAQLPTPTSDFRTKVLSYVGSKEEREAIKNMQTDNYAVQSAGQPPGPTTVTQAGKYEAPPGPPPSPDMKWSPYSKKWVTVVRGPYSKQR